MTARVLIADDDAVVRDVVRRYLEHDGLEVLVAADGNEALRILGTERIDVAVLDVMMPGPNGLSLCRTLRQGGDYTVPVILLTALAEEDDRIAGLEAGLDVPAVADPSAEGDGADGDLVFLVDDEGAGSGGGLDDGALGEGDGVWSLPADDAGLDELAWEETFAFFTLRVDAFVGVLELGAEGDAAGGGVDDEAEEVHDAVEGVLGAVDEEELARLEA